MRYKNPPDYAEADTDYDDVDVVENPASVVRTARDERLWSMAKKSAADQGRARDWPYIMGIFQHMKHRTGSEPVGRARQNPAPRTIGPAISKAIRQEVGRNRTLFPEVVEYAYTPGGQTPLGEYGPARSIYKEDYGHDVGINMLDVLDFRRMDDAALLGKTVKFMVVVVESAAKYDPSVWESEDEWAMEVSDDGDNMVYGEVHVSPSGQFEITLANRRARQNPANRIRVSPGAYSALEVYVFDPAHIEGGAYDDEGSVETSRDILSSVVPGGLAAPSEDEPQRCWAWHARLSYAAESAAESGDYPAAKALNNLASKCIDPLR